MPAIEIIDLTKKFGDTVAVNRLNLAIEEGVFFTFLGPNGAGKTTTMKLMAGLLQPTAGTVRLHGVDIGEDPVAAKALIGYIPDHPFLYAKLTGWEFLQFIGGLYRMPRREIREEGKKLFDIFGLNGQSDRLIETYSHGMRQRLAFTACFLHRPKVVIIDEPWVGLDPHNIRTAISFLRQRACEGTTIFMSTHSLDIAEEIAERIGILHRGQLIFEGETSTLRASSSKDLEEAFLELTAEEETLGGGS